MAMTCLNNRKNDSFILSTIDELVPSDHKVRELEEAIDWTFIYPLVRPLYSSFGRPSIDPVVLFKMLFINFTFGIHSMRRTCEEIKVNLAYRWFLGLSIDDEVPNYSTWSQNYIRRYGDSEIFDEIFNRIIEEAIAYDFVDLDTVFGDGTHRKANANSRKHENKVVEIVKKHYDDELLEEINKDREEHGKKALKETKDIELAYDEETGELIEGKGTKSIKVSKTDPESGCFHKGEKQKCFAYTNLTFCDRHGFVLHNTVAPGNQHDSVVFHDAYRELLNTYGDSIHNISLDAGFITPAICREIIEDGIRYTPEWKDIYPLRKETIERVYADCKEKHGLRFTRIRGLKKNQQESLIIFGCHNLGKLARMKKRRGLINMTSPNKKERHIRKIVQIYQFA